MHLQMRLLTLLCCILGVTAASSNYKLNTCGGSSFCRTSSPQKRSLDHYDQRTRSGTIQDWDFHFDVLQGGNLRVRIDQGQKFKDAWRWSLVEEPQVMNVKDNLKFGDYQVKIDKHNFKIEFWYKKQLQIVVNERQLLDHSSIDFSFHGYNHVYGIPEHADSLSLRDTTGGEPYRLFNVDVFEYEVDSTKPMYAAVPFMVAHKPQSAAGLFWINAADTWIDIEKTGKKVNTHWMSEDGVIDFILFVKDTPLEVTQEFAKLTGKMPLPDQSMLGYHQCRWNYNDETDVKYVDRNMDDHRIPYDVMWLDIEYTVDKKYFTWDNSKFPDPRGLIKNLEHKGRSMVAILDPHLKSDYELSATVDVIMNTDGSPYKGQCWPGESVWIDTFSPEASEKWSQKVSEFIGDSRNLHIWNDMNEPSVFNGIETTTPKNLIHFGGYEERSVHNLYGKTVHDATFNGMNQRPFVLTRSFFAGSQRTAATWTGDNSATWDYLRISVPMILSSNVAGMPFIGADVGGFSGNPSSELMVRWYQAGMWYPFFRGHAHIDSRRREPYLLEDMDKELAVKAIRQRYQLLPYIYTNFYNSSVTGAPVFTPLFYKFPQDVGSFEIDDQFFVGDIMVKPIVHEHVTEVSVYFPDNEWYYDLESSKAWRGHGNHMFETNLATTHAFIRGGSIVTIRSRYRRSAKLMNKDPFTLVIALSSKGTAYGTLFLDDQNEEPLLVNFAYKNGELSSTMEIASDKYPLRVEKVIIKSGNGQEKVIKKPEITINKECKLKI